MLGNFASLPVMQGADYILPFITVPYLTRVLGPAHYGLIGFAAALINYFAILTGYGFNLSATKEISLKRDDRERISGIFSSIMIIKAGLLAASLILPLVIVYSFDKFRADAAVYLISFGLVVGNALFPVWLFQGMERMKYITYINCAGRIALADQNDFWFPEKLARIADAFSATPSAGIVFSDALPADEHLNPLGATLWDRFEFTRKRRKKFDSGNAWKVLLEKNTVTGATMAFRKRYADMILPIPPSWVHDARIAFIVSLYADPVYMDEPLIWCRQHPGQQIGAREKAGLTMKEVFGDNAGSYANEFRHYSHARLRLKKLRGTVPDYEGEAKAFRDKTAYCYVRSRMPAEKHKRIVPVAANPCAFRYHRYANGFLSAAKDLFLN